MKWLYANRKADFPSIEILLEIGAVLPLSNAVSERGFSAMNYIKGKRSANMSTGEGITAESAGDADEA